jgi:hypothetical protein
MRERVRKPAPIARAPAPRGSLGTALGSGQPLSQASRDRFEPRLGHDFSRIRVHADGEAARSAGAIDALAYTSGEDIVFGAGRYAPETTDGAQLLAHELAHAVQQDRGVVAPGLGRRDDAHEQQADAVAGHVLNGGDARAMLPARSGGMTASAGAVQRKDPPAKTSDPNSLVPVADFIGYVEIVERKFPTDTPKEIVTRIRTEYYSGMAFEFLIPDAHFQRNAPAQAQAPGGGTPIKYPNNLSDMRWDPSTKPAYDHLTAHADENAIGDNPSPYIVMPDGSRIDAGHLLLGLDALLNPRTDSPYTTYGIPSIDPAGFAADLALAAYWMTYHQREGHPASDAAIKPATADFNAYYAASAPNEDLLGDADAFAAADQWGARPGQTLSQVLRATYLGGPSGAAPGIDQRWRTFCSKNGLGYTANNGAITWSGDIEANWLPRIDRLCDLFDSGFFSHVGTALFNTSPSRGTWPWSRDALTRFLAWLKPRLEAEIRAHP